MEGFTDVNLNGYLDSRKNITCYVFIIGGTSVSWMSRRYISVSLSTTKANYMTIAGNVLIWLKYFILELGMKQETTFFIVTIKVQFTSLRI